MVQYGRVWYSIVQYGTVWYSMVEYGIRLPYYSTTHLSLSLLQGKDKEAFQSIQFKYVRFTYIKITYMN